MKGLVIGGIRSGCGKTTVAIGLMAALKRRGYQVAPFKVGPDFIDPGYHFRATGVVSRNLDGWMLSSSYNIDCFKRNSLTADIAIVEGVMGLFDGYDGKSENGSTAQIAKWLNLPVLLIVDAKSMARSAAALVQGFENFDKDLKFLGVVFNHVSSDRHMLYLKQSLEGYVNMPCLGGIAQNKNIAVPERHLGLVTQEDHPLSDQDIAKFGDIIEQSINIDELIANIPQTHISFDQMGYVNTFENKSTNDLVDKTRPKIGVAKDNAFCFYYQDNLDLLQSLGAEIVYFSPMNDTDLPEVDGLYFGGGYPELYLDKLVSQQRIRSRILNLSLKGMPIYAECGGFMYLSTEICDGDGDIYPMVGCFPFSIRMNPHLKSLGYREITLVEDTIIGKKGTVIRGHEFHYSDISEKFCPVSSVYRTTDRMGENKSEGGYQIANTLGSYIHLHFGSNIQTAVSFVESCRKFQKYCHNSLKYRKVDRKNTDETK